MAVVNSVSISILITISVAGVITLAPMSLTEGDERISCFLVGSVQPTICPLPGFFAEDPLFIYESDPHQAGLPMDERMKLDRPLLPSHAAKASG